MVSRRYSKGCAADPSFTSGEDIFFSIFLASKIEAFRGRGGGDYYGSPDMEDIISILETHPKEMIISSLEDTSAELRTYLRDWLIDLKTNDGFLDALSGATFNRFEPDEGVQNVMESIELLLKKIHEVPFET